MNTKFCVECNGYTPHDDSGCILCKSTITDSHILNWLQEHRYETVAGDILSSPAIAAIMDARDKPLRQVVSEIIMKDRQ